ncbi:MAG: hypothetical protein NC115_02970 [Bacteroidales bacterium]|nr:hypothetical protein [Bacteroides sp.]MCM1199202.1 hypothetical protein [Clostridium sp.]MCM1501617.1 hypothetical protein [Bacteroidales bacterium]
MYRKTLTGLYHVFTDGLKQSLLFNSDADFIAAMNRLAFCTITCNVRIAAFCLMDNHIHVILRGTYDNSRKFVNTFFRAYSIYSSRHASIIRKEAVDVGIKAIKDADYLCKVIAYVLRNPMSAGDNTFFSDYPWSSAGLYFRRKGYCIPSWIFIGEEAGRCEWVHLKDIKSRQRRMLLGTRLCVPEDWICDATSGMIWPGCYVDYAFVENTYRTVRRFIYYLSQRNEEEMDAELDLLDVARLSDKDLRTMVMEMSKTDYGTSNVNSLGYEEKLALARTARRKLGVPFRQLSRVVGLPEETLKSYV